MANELDTPATTLTLLNALIPALTKGAPASATTIVVSGEGGPVTDLVTEMKGYQTTYQKVVDAEEALKIALEERTQSEPIALPRIRGTVDALKGMLGPKNPALKNYGIEPEKEPTPLTVDQKAERNAKALATRAARHTMGKKQKKSIKGQVPAAPPAPPLIPPKTSV